MEWELIKVYLSHSQHEKLKNHPEFFGDFRQRLYQYRVQKEDLQANPAGTSSSARCHISER